MVGAGAGATLLPQMAIATEVRRADRITLRRFKRDGPHRTIGLCWRPNSARADGFRELASVFRDASS